MPSPSLTVAITDWTFPDLAVETRLLESHGIAVAGRQCKTEAELIALVANADAVVTQFARINSAVIGAMAKARCIVRYGIGVDNVDLEAARARNIPVCNIPDYCIDEVADQTLAFMLACTRQVVANALHLRAGHWGLPVPLAAMNSLRHCTVGIVGFGRIGRAVVQRLIGFGCAVRVFDPAVPSEAIAASGAESVTLEQLLAVSDLVSPHCPSTPQTRRMFNAAAFGRMKPGAILVNVGRGDLVDSAALLEALNRGQLGGAALDVFDPEPIPVDHPIRRLPNVLLSAHIASASPTAVQRLRESVAATAARGALGQPLLNVVNGVSSRS